MNTPQIFTANAIKNWNTSAYVNKKWVPARSLGLQGLFLKTRIYAAYLVFTGKCDVLKWN